MRPLSDWQAEFAAAILGRGGPPGLAVYRGNAFGNWAQALANAYPVVRRTVGESFFEGLAHAYARAHPSASGDLNEYGERLPQFVASFPHTQDLRYLPDVARLEWLVHRAYYAADAAPFNLTDLSGSSPLALAPACALLASDWPLAQVWTVHQDDYEGGTAVDLYVRPDRVLVHRPRWRVQVRSLGAGDWRFLHCAARRATLSAALEAAVSEDPDFDPSLALAGWVDAGVITI